VGDMRKQDDDAPREPPSPKWLKGVHHENSKVSKKHENRLAERLGGRRYSGSGNRPISRKSYRPVLKDGRSRKIREVEGTDCGDLATPTFHFEHKFTRDQSLSVKLEWLDKVEEGAKRKLKDPGLIITFQDQQGHVLKEYVGMPIAVYERLMRKVDADVS
jgi:hypothetical protein